MAARSLDRHVTFMSWLRCHARRRRAADRPLSTSLLVILLGYLSFAVAALLRTVAAAAEAPIANVRLIGLTEDNTLVQFTAAQPGDVTMTKISRISGRVLGIDYRPTDGRLYAVTSANNLCTIDPVTGTARLVCSLTLSFDGGSRSGVDFNPQTDRLRILGSNGQNLRVHPDIGAAAADTGLAYGRRDRHVGKVPAIVAVAYTNSVVGANETKTFDVDASLDILALQEPPNDGTLQTIGRLGVDFDSAAGFDILTDAQGGDHAFAVSGSRLYSIDLASGAATLIGVVGSGNLRLIGLAVVPARLPGR